MLEDSKQYHNFYSILKNSEFFKDLKNESLYEFLNLSTVEVWDKGTIFSQTKKTLYNFYFIVSGRVKMYKMNPQNGNEFTLYIHSKGDIFDIITLLENKPHTIEMEALDKVTLLSMPIDMIRKWVQIHPEFNKKLLPYIVDQLKVMEEKASDIALLNTWTRTVKLFAQNTNQGKENHELKLINNLSHYEIAKVIGTSKNVINRHLQILKEKNILHVNRKHIEIKDHIALLEMLNKF